MPLPSALPAPFGNFVVVAGMLNTTQCHQPAPPVGASGSCTRTAKLFVSLGAPDHSSAGDTFCPLQPKPLNVCSAAIVAPGLISALIRRNVAPAASAVSVSPVSRAAA